MIKNILFLIACTIIVGLSLVVFQIFGMYTFTIMIVITVVGLLKGVKPKFGGKDKANK